MAVNLYATPGYAFEVTLSHEGGNEVKGLAYNFHTGESVPLSGVSSETYSGASAEYIAERPGTSGGLAPLADYGQWDVIEAWANGNHTLGPWAFKNTALNIVESGTLLSETSGLSSQESGREFYTTWHGYNHASGSTCPSPPDPPKVAAQTPRNITRTTAELAAQVYPGKYETGYYFEYGRTTGYGSRVPLSGEYHLSPAENWDQIYTPVSGLTSCSTYDFRIIATNIYGETADGPNEELTTQCKPPKATTYPPSEITRTTAKLEAQVYPNGVSTEYYFSYNEVGGSPKSTVKEYVGSNEEWHWVDKVVSGLKSCTPYEVTVFAKNADGEKRAENTELFETECWPPKATTTAAKEVKRTSAELEGEVYPNGLKTEYWFEYGKKGSFESKTTVTEAGSNDAWHAEHSTVSTLEPCHEYQFRVVAENEDSHNGPPKGDVYGETKYFETKCKPLIQSVKTSELKPNSVVLNAEVNPQEAETTYHFEYDTREYKEGEAAHGTSVPAQPASIGSGAAYVKVNDAVVNLVPDQTYYYRTVAKNVSGETLGAGQSFKAPEDWELGGKLVTASKAVKSEGGLVVEDTGLAAECSVKTEGSVGGEGSGEITTVTGAKGESVISCAKTKTSSCEGSTAEVEATGLPWKTELVDEPIKNEKGEVVRYEVRERFYGSGGTAPGWTLKCTAYGGFKVTRSCSGEPSGDTENVAAGVPAEFEGKSKRLTCEGKEGAGAVEGALVFAGTEGTLSVYGAKAGPLAPDVVTGAATNVTSTGATMNGTVAAKGVKAEYQFEYGTTTSYGTKVPVPEGKAGEGRTRVEVGQALTGLETSTVYHYRLAATNNAGTTYGEDKTFTPGYPASWQVGGKGTELSSVKGEGTLVVEDAGLSAECVVQETGEVGALSPVVNKIEKVTNTKGESVIACGKTKASGCEGSVAEVEATGLPWKTELVDEPIKNDKGEVLRDEVRERLYGTEATPGWKLKCTAYGGVKVTRSCSGEVSGNVENASAGVPGEFDGKSKRLTCEGKEGAGAVEGALVFTSTEGALSVYGGPTGPLAPDVVTSAATNVTSTGATVNGTVAARGVKTGYRFEYGTSTGYGISVPAKGEAGEGRARVTESETLSGLEPSTLYHYRLVATNSAGTTYGEDKTFTPGYPASWQVGGKGTELSSVKGEGTVVVEDAGLSAECVVQETGEVGALSPVINKIEKVTNTKGESLLSCGKGKSSECEGASAEVEATGLPWKTELVDEPIKNEKGEVLRDEVRERFYGTEGTPGWKLKCTAYGGVKVTRTCSGEVSGNIENASSGVPVEFDGKSKHMTCEGKEGAGVSEGVLVFTSTEGTVSVYGAKTGPLPPDVVTDAATGVTSTAATLNGTIAAKGVKTDYHFEYGTSTGYGTKIPVAPEGKAGEGRTRVEVSLALSGVEPSTLYHYRLVATNSGGTSYGEDKTFTPGYHAGWQINGKGAEFTPVKGEGTLVVADAGLSAECVVQETGETGTLSALNKIEKVTGVKGETVMSCGKAKSSECEGATAEVEATGLPWKTELVDEPIKNEKGEVLRDEVRERFYGTEGTMPGWKLKCTAYDGVKVTRSCSGEPSGNVENVAAGVPVEFDGKSKRLTCEGKEGAGAVEGALVFAGTEGALSVYGAKTGPLAPDVVTGAATGVTSSGATMDGTVAARGVKTEYHFEYGTNTSYGTKVPVAPEGKAGEGRTRVEVSQALTGLEVGTVYHYRLVATSSGGTGYGEDKTFTPGLPAAWDLNGKTAELTSVKAEGTLIVEDTGLGVEAECTVTETGYAGTLSHKIEKVTNTKGESKFTCHALKQGSCGEAAVEVNATGLPWSTELVDAPIENEKGEVVRYEPRERFYGSSMPGWQLSCKVFGSVASDTCTGEPSGNVENVTAGVPVEFDSKSPSLACTGSAIGAGTVEGVLLFTSTEGTLSVYGAKTGPLPPAVATGEPNGVTSSGASLNGTVAAKALETTYHFEYGTSTKYGSRVPLSEEAKAGSGRTRVPVSQSVTGLEASTVYHYRIVATNSAGTSYGEDETFTTAP